MVEMHARGSEPTVLSDLSKATHSVRVGAYGSLMGILDSGSQVNLMSSSHLADLEKQYGNTITLTKVKPAVRIVMADQNSGVMAQGVFHARLAFPSTLGTVLTKSAVPIHVVNGNIPEMRVGKPTLADLGIDVDAALGALLQGGRWTRTRSAARRISSARTAALPSHPPLPRASPA